MIRVNLLRSALTSGIYRRPPRSTLDSATDRMAECEPRVQLDRVIGGRKVPAPKLHRVGYRVTPHRAAPRCSDGNGPYGAVVWIRVGAPLGTAGRQRIQICAECERRAGRSP